jgi:HK97 family phage major capsid protein
MSATIKVPKELRREALIERTEQDGKHGFKMSISSDIPYKRYDWWNEREYYEVLDHSPGGCNDARLKKGLPILFNHDRDQHLGRATSYSNDGHKYEVTDLIWSESEFAQTKKKDAENGSLPDTSVGYRLIDEGVEIGKKDGLPIYKFRWEIHEASLVTIPADISVGVGRSKPDEKGEFVELSVRSEQETLTNENLALAKTLKNENTPAMADTTTAAPEQKIDVVQERNTAIAAERKRSQDIKELSGHFATNGLGGRKIDTSELADQFVREGKTVNEFQDAVVRGNFKEAKPVVAANVSEGMTERDISKYSVMRAINSVIGATQGKRFEGLEREMSDEVAKNHGRPASTLGFYIPHDVMARSHNLALTREQRTLFATGSFTAAGALVPIGAQGQSLIDLYRNKMHVVAMGAQVLGGLQGTLAIPRQTGGATAAWLAEDATITASNQAVGQLTLTPHRLAAATAFSTQLLAQASPDIENFVRNDLMTVLAVEKDRAALLGSGSAGEPLGIYNTPNIATTVDITATASITYAEAVQFETNVAAGNADLGSLGYITSVFIRGTARVTPKFANTGMPLWDGDMLGSYPARATNQLTAVPSVIFGNWADMIIGDWASPEIIVDPYSLSMANQIRIVVHQLTDVGIRHPKSFCFGVV